MGPQQVQRSNGVTFKWLVTIAAGAFITIGGWAWSSTVDRVIALEATKQALGERQVKTETEVQALKEQLQDQKALLQRMDSKLDELRSR